MNVDDDTKAVAKFGAPSDDQYGYRHGNARRSVQIILHLKRADLENYGEFQVGQSHEQTFRRWMNSYDKCKHFSFVKELFHEFEEERFPNTRVFHNEELRSMVRELKKEKPKEEITHPRQMEWLRRRLETEGMIALRASHSNRI